MECVSSPATKAREPFHYESQPRVGRVGERMGMEVMMLLWKVTQSIYRGQLSSLCFPSSYNEVSM